MFRLAGDEGDRSDIFVLMPASVVEEPLVLDLARQIGFHDDPVRALVALFPLDGLFSGRTANPQAPQRRADRFSRIFSACPAASPRRLVHQPFVGCDACSSKVRSAATAAACTLATALHVNTSAIHTRVVRLLGLIGQDFRPSASGAQAGPSDRHRRAIVFEQNADRLGLPTLPLCTYVVRFFRLRSEAEGLLDVDDPEQRRKLLAWLLGVANTAPQPLLSLDEFLRRRRGGGHETITTILAELFYGHVHRGSRTAIISTARPASLSQSCCKEPPELLGKWRKRRENGGVRQAAT
jgi:hypothetical protein